MDHTKRNCKVKCTFCERTGHSKDKCYFNPKSIAKNKTSSGQKPAPPSKPATKKSKDKSATKPAKNRQTVSDPEESSSDIEYPGNSSDHKSDRLTHIDSKVRRLARFDPRQLSMGDAL